MMIRRRRLPKPKNASGQRSCIPVTTRFLLTWLSFIGMLAVLALLTDINWAKSFMQEQMAESLHRKVELGKLGWNLGLDGLAVETKSLSVSDPSGAPFLKSKHSEIGIAFLPLFKGRVIIRHVILHSRRSGPCARIRKTWNFTDLLHGPEIHSSVVRRERCMFPTKRKQSQRGNRLISTILS